MKMSMEVVVASWILASRCTIFSMIDTRRQWQGGRRKGQYVSLGFVVAIMYYLTTAVKADGDLSLSKSLAPNSFHNNHFAQDSIGALVNEEGSKHNVGAPPPLEFAHGTTTLAFTFGSGEDGGIVVAVDSRASLGNFVGSKTVLKVLPVNTHCLATMAGGAADCSFWIRKLRSAAALYEQQTGQFGRSPRRMSVARASRILSNVLYNNRRLKLSMGTMVMGFDDHGCDDDSSIGNNDGIQERDAAGGRIFYVDNTGMRIEGDLFSVGSGSSFALGILDTEHRPGMQADEAVVLAIKAIRHATFRDAASGGFINVFLITRKHGIQRVFTEDLVEMAELNNK